MLNEQLLRKCKDNSLDVDTTILLLLENCLRFLCMSLKLLNPQGKEVDLHVHGGGLVGHG